MAIIPTIISPGVELVEYDESVRAATPAGTTIFCQGFTPQGPTGEVTFLTGLDEFVQIFGYPTTAAERYCYKTVADALSTNANVSFVRFPYGAGTGDTSSLQFTVLAYPAKAYTLDYDTTVGSEETVFAHKVTLDGGDVYGIQTLTPTEEAKKETISFVAQKDESGAVTKLVKAGTEETFTLNAIIATEIYDGNVTGSQIEKTGLQSDVSADIDVILASAKAMPVQGADGEFVDGYTIDDYTHVTEDSDEPLFTASVTQYKTKSVEAVAEAGGAYAVVEKDAVVTDPVVLSAETGLYNIASSVKTKVNYKYTEAAKYTDGAKGFATKVVDPDTGRETYEVKGEGGITYLLGEPTQFNLSIDEYYKFLNGQALGKDAKMGDEFVWDENIPADGDWNKKIENLGKFAFLVVNVGKTVTNEEYEGYYLGLCDNAFTDPGSSYDSIRKMKTVTENATDASVGLWGSDFTNIPEERCDFQLSSTLKGSISQILEESITSTETSNPFFNDTLNIGIFKVRKSVTSGDATKLSALITSGYNAALGYKRETTSKFTTVPVDFFVENVSKQADNVVNFFVNPWVSGENKTRGLYADGTPKAKVRMFSKQLSRPFTFDGTSVVGDFGGAPKQDELNTLTVDQAIAEPTGITAEIYDTIATGDKFNFADNLYPLGLFAKSDNSSKVLGNIPEKIRIACDLVANDELYNVDLVPEGGLATIYAGALDNARKAYATMLDALIKSGKTEAEAKAEIKKNYITPVIGETSLEIDYLPGETFFDDTKFITGVANMRTGKSSLPEDAETVIADFRAVQQSFLANLCCSAQEGGRGDCFFIGDGLRHIMVEGKDSKIQKQFGQPLITDVYTAANKVNHSFSTSIYWPLRHLFNGIASSYMAVYPHFVKANDPTTGVQYWAPSSGSVVRRLAATDAMYGPWQAAAGLSNGIITGVSDISFDTTQRQRDDLYKLGLNCICNRADSGITIWGIRTMIKKESSFDQITCRRTFLYIEKLLKATAKQFLFEGNTVYTRLRVVNALRPILQTIQDAGGIYNFVLICDERNNTVDVIDRGDMMIDFYAAATRTGERILIGAHATNLGTSTTAEFTGA